ncbi:MAG TPA: alpha/beta fold hydrolase [Longimicrobiales bacterium]|nr:alpha/beta fold hydrolase [Longimicrobiales bacterium]
MTEMNGPHQGQQVAAAGTPLHEAHGAMVMVHGRGATAASILTLAEPLYRDRFAYLAPQASGNTWYPQSFLAPMQNNQPGIDSGLRAISEVLERIAAARIPLERTILLGFSQGACLASEYMARHARLYGGLAALSGGLIGPPGTPRDYAGTLDGTPVFLGCSDVDSHIPAERVEESAEVFERLGAVVTKRIYPGMGHTVNEDEIVHVQAMMDAVLAS